MSGHGPPKVGDVFLFAAGAIVGFALVAVVGRAAGSGAIQPGTRDLLTTGVMHVGAVGAAIGAAALLAEIPGAVAWPLASFAATALYLAVVSLELLVARRQAGST